MGIYREPLYRRRRPPQPRGSVDTYTKLKGRVTQVTDHDLWSIGLQICLAYSSKN